MSYLPIGLNLKNKNILLVGGGVIAYQKLEKLIQFFPQRIRIVAKNISNEVNQMARAEDEIVSREFTIEDLENTDFVIVAIDDQSKQREIYQLCQQRKILCNCVDLLDCCDFIFNAYVKKDDIIISISTNGKIPGLSAVLKNYIEQNLPKNLPEIFDELVLMRRTMSPGADRMKKIREKASELLGMVSQ